MGTRALLLAYICVEVEAATIALRFTTNTVTYSDSPHTFTPTVSAADGTSCNATQIVAPGIGDVSSVTATCSFSVEELHQVRIIAPATNAWNVLKAEVEVGGAWMQLWAVNHSPPNFSTFIDNDPVYPESAEGIWEMLPIRARFTTHTDADSQSLFTFVPSFISTAGVSCTGTSIPSPAQGEAYWSVGGCFNESDLLRVDIPSPGFDAWNIEAAHVAGSTLLQWVATNEVPPSLSTFVDTSSSAPQHAKAVFQRTTVKVKVLTASAAGSGAAVSFEPQFISQSGDVCKATVIVNPAVSSTLWTLGACSFAAEDLARVEIDANGNDGWDIAELYVEANGATVQWWATNVSPAKRDTTVDDDGLAEYKKAIFEREAPTAVPTQAPRTPAPLTPFPPTPTPPTPLPSTLSPPTPLPLPTPAPNTAAPYTEAPSTSKAIPTPTESNSTAHKFSQEEVISSMGTATAGVAALGAASGAGTATRLVLVSGACLRSGSSQSFPFPLHPTGIQVAGSVAAGAVVGNVSIVVGFTVLMRAVLGLLRRSGKLLSCIVEGADTQGLLRFPSVPLFMFTLLYQGTTLAGMLMVLHPENAGFLAGGVATLAACACVPVCMFRVVVKDVPSKAVYKHDPEIMTIWKILLCGPGEWVSVGEDVHWVNRYASVTRTYLQKTAWFFVVEYGAAFTLAAIGALETETWTGCGHTKLAMSVVFAVTGVVEAVVWPHARPKDNVFQIILQGLQCSALVLMAVGFYSRGDIGTHWAHYVTEKLFLLSGIVLLVKAATDAAAEIYVLASGRRTRLQVLQWEKSPHSWNEVGGVELQHFEPSSPLSIPESPKATRCKLTHVLHSAHSLYSLLDQQESSHGESMSL